MADAGLEAKDMIDKEVQEALKKFIDYETDMAGGLTGAGTGPSLDRKVLVGILHEVFDLEKRGLISRHPINR
jgi:hypothetical protein